MKRLLVKVEGVESRNILILHEADRDDPELVDPDRDGEDDRTLRDG